MSKTIDERVVSMKFNNENFEKNVATSMSTLDKLKEKLSFKGASKGIDELNGAMRRFDASPIEKGLDAVAGSVHNKINGWQESLKGFFRKLGEDVEVWVKNTIKSMSGLDNMAAGFGKFSDKTTAVTTLVAQGFDLETVNEQMDKLNWFTDETSYNFIEMVNSIGKFTASGQNLEDSVSAMMGIADWAALSGQNAAKASQAMYQLSQAMSKGALRYDDWKSIQNASMDTKEFREMAAGAAIELGSMVKVGEDAYKVVYENDKGVKELSDDIYTLNELFSSDGLTKTMWLDTDVMMNVFGKYGQAVKTLKALVDENWEDADTASSAMDVLEEKAKSLADQLLASGKVANSEEAMNQALMQTSLEAAAGLSSVRDEVEAYAKETGKDISTTEGFNNVLIELGYGMDTFSLKALKAAQQARTWEDVVDSVKDAVSTAWMNIFEKIIGDQQEAVTLMTRLANDFWDIFAAPVSAKNDVFAIWREWYDEGTRKTIEAANAGGDSVKKAILENAKVINGRDLLFSTDENDLGAVISLLQTIKTLLATVKDAWNEIFYGSKDEDVVAQKKADILMAITKALKAFADAVAIDDKKADKLRRTFKGLFAILDIIATLVKSVLNGVLKALGGILGDINIDIFDTTAGIGDMLVAFRDWIKENNVFGKTFEWIGEGIANFVTWIKNLIEYVKSIPWVADALANIGAGFTTAGNAIKEFFDRIFKGEKAGDVFTDIIDRIKETPGVVSWLIDSFTNVKNFFEGLFTGIGDFFKTALSSISEGNFNIGDIFTNIGKAFENAKNGVGEFWKSLQPTLDTIKLYFDGFVYAIQQTLSGLSAEKIAKIVGAAALFYFITKLISIFKIITDAIKAFGEIGENLSKAIKNISGAISTAVSKISKAVSRNLNARSFKIIAEALLMLVGALTVLYFMAMNNGDALNQAAIILGSIAAGLVVLSVVAGKTNGLIKVAIGIGAIAGALLVLVLSLKLLTGIEDIEKGWNAVGMIAAMAGIMLVVTAIVAIGGKILAVGVGGGFNMLMKSLVVFMIGFAAAVLAMSFAAEKLANVPSRGLKQATSAIWNLVGAITVLTVVSKIFGGGMLKGIGKAMLGLAVGLVVIAGAIKLFSMFEESIFTEGLKRVGFVSAIFIALVAVSAFAGEHGASAGSMILKMSVAFLVLIGVIALINLLDGGAIVKGLAVIIAFGAICAALVAVSYFAGEHASKAGTMLLTMSIAITILTGVIWALSFLSVEDLTKAGIVVAGIMILFGGLIAVTKLAAKTKNLKGTLIVLTIAIVALAASVAALALISSSGDVIKASIAMGLVLGMFALVIAMTKFAQKAMGTLIVLTIAVAAIGTVLWLLTKDSKDSGTALQAAEGLAIILGVMAGVLFVLSKISVSNPGTLAVLIVALLGLGIVVEILAGVLNQIKMINPENAVTQALAMSILLAVLTGIIAAFAALGGGLGNAGMGGGAVAGLVAGSVVLGLLAWLVIPCIADAINKMAGIDGNAAVQYATAITIALGAMAGVIAVFGLIGGVAGLGGVAGIIIGAVGMAAMAIGTLVLWLFSSTVLPAVAAAITAMSVIDGNSAVQYANALSSFLTSLIGNILLLAIVGAMALPAIVGMGLLVILLAGMGAIAVAVGKLVEETPQIQEFLDKGIPVLNQLATEIGAFFGNIIAGFIDAVASGVLNILPIFGEKLSQFGEKVEPFVNMMKTDNTTAFDNMSKFATAIIAITAANFLDGVTRFLGVFTGGQSGMDSFAEGLKSLGTGVANFSTEVNGKVNQGEVDNAVTALNKLVVLAQSVDAFKTIAGAAGLDYLAISLGLIGSGAAAFTEKVNGKVDNEQIDNAIKALETLVGLASNTNAFTTISGTVGLDVLSTSLGYIGSGAAAFSQAVDGKVNYNNCVDAAKVVEKLAEVAEKAKLLETLGGTLALDALSSNLGNIGKGIAEFGTEVKDKVDVTYTGPAVDAIERLSAVGSNIGFLEAIAGIKGLEIFASNLSSVGAGIAQFSMAAKTGGIDKEITDTALSVLERLHAIQSSQNFIEWLGGSIGLTSFSSNLGYIGSGVATFSTNIQGKIHQQDTDGALTIMQKIMDFAKSHNSWIEFLGTVQGLSNMDVFASNMPFIAQGIAAFSQAVYDAGTANPEAAEAGIDALGAITDLNGVIVDVIDATKMQEYTTRLSKYEEALKSLGETLGTIFDDSEKFDPEKITNISSNLDELSKIADKAGSIDPTKLETLKSTLSTNWLGGGTGSPIDLSQYMNFGDMSSGGGTNALLSQFEGMMKGDGSSGGLFDIDLSDVTKDWSSDIFGGLTGALGSGGDFDIGKGIEGIFKGDGSSGGLLGMDLSSVTGDWGDKLMNGLTGTLSTGEGSSSGEGIIDKIEGLFKGNGSSGGLLDVDLSSVGKQFGIDLSGGLAGAFSGENGVDNAETKKDLDNAGGSIVDGLSSGMKSKQYDFEQSGRYAVEGLCNAIKNMAPYIKETGGEIAKSLESGVRLSLKIASPSKVMYGLGEFAGEGFINALTDYISVSGAAGEDLGVSATDGLREALEQGAKAFDTTVDVEPTIRPVLDLSNVNEGMGQLDGMFDSSRSIALAGKVNASMADSNMNVQNEVKVDNSDVVNELNGLRDDFNIMVDKLSRLQVVMDSDTVVGVLADPMDRELGQRAVRSGRR